MRFCTGLLGYDGLRGNRLNRGRNLCGNLGFGHLNGRLRNGLCGCLYGNLCNGLGGAQRLGGLFRNERLKRSFIDIDGLRVGLFDPQLPAVRNGTPCRVRAPRGGGSPTCGRGRPIGRWIEDECHKKAAFLVLRKHPGRAVISDYVYDVYYRFKLWHSFMDKKPCLVVFGGNQGILFTFVTFNVNPRLNIGV